MMDWKMKCASAFKLIVDIGHFHLSPEPKHENAIGSTSNKLLVKRITTHMQASGGGFVKHYKLNLLLLKRITTHMHASGGGFVKHYELNLPLLEK